MQPFDALTMRAILQEAKPVLLNRRVEKIQQISRDEVVIALRSKAGTGNLLVSAQSSFGRICLMLNAPVPKSPNPPAFCQLLRKYLMSAVLVGMEQLPGERIADLKFSCVDELGNRSGRVLTAEIMGRHSNLILWDQDTEKILAASHNVTQDMSRQREVGPGLRYCRPPRQEKLGIFQISESEFRAKFEELKASFALVVAGESRQDDSVGDSSSAVKTFEQWLIHSFAGLGRHLGEEIVQSSRLPGQLQSELLNEETFSTLWAKIFSLQQTVEYKPAMRTDLSRFTVLSWCKAEENEAQQESPWKSFPSVNDMVDAYFRSIQLRTEIQQLKERIRAELKNEQEKLETRLGSANKLLTGAGDHQRYRDFGNLILTNVHAIQSGQASLACADLFASDGSSVTIELNPNLSPSQNAQNYYRQYAKSRTRTQTAEATKKDAEKRLEDLVAQCAVLEQAETLPELQVLKERILDRGKRSEAPARSSSAGGRERPAQQRLLSIKSSDGLTIIVGRNKHENDVLVSKLAQPHDIWMHAQGLEGAHVLVKVYGKKDPPLNTLKEAAQVAARFSRSGLGGRIKVAYTYAKYVRKIAKDKPGLVRYENEKTLEIDTAAPMPPSLRKLFS